MIAFLTGGGDTPSFSGKTGNPGSQQAPFHLFLTIASGEVLTFFGGVFRRGVSLSRIARPVVLRGE